ncbi:hypothetical protein F5Y18DRAFT_124139 [Xylariaceae sp. FL1019]|nr:hypothetical protein F5Y18DRAFT_124139 [Xylariaceae sp. FL1019]
MKIPFFHSTNRLYLALCVLTSSRDALNRMASFYFAILGLAFGSRAIAAPAPGVTTFPGAYECPTGYETITSTRTPMAHCFVKCPAVTTICGSGQLPHIPFPSTTSTLAPSCTVEVIIEPPNCGPCNTCEPAPTTSVATLQRMTEGQ